MTIPSFNQLFEFYQSISETYNLQIWNVNSFSNHFKIDASNFVEDPEKEYLVIQQKNNPLDWRSGLLSGTIFFLKRRRMIRSLPIFFEIDNLEDFKFLTDPNFIAKTDKIIRREIILDSIRIRIFKIGNKIYSATDNYPVNFHKSIPKIPLEALKYIENKNNDIIEIVNQGYICYVDYFDPMYVDSVSKNLYLSNITNSQGAFLSSESIQKFSKEAKIAYNEDILNPLKLPMNPDGWKNFYMNCLENFATDTNLGYLFKINFKVTDKFTEKIFLKLKNPYSLNIHNNVHNINNFYQKLYRKIIFQIPYFIQDDSLLQYFQNEIIKNYSQETYTDFYQKFLKNTI